MTETPTLKDFVAHVLEQIAGARAQGAPDDAKVEMTLAQASDVFSTWLEQEKAVKVLRREVQIKAVTNAQFRIIEIQPGESATVEEDFPVVVLPRRGGLMFENAKLFEKDRPNVW